MKSDCLEATIRMTDDADPTCCGKLFQTRVAQTGKARSLLVESGVVRTISDGGVSSTQLNAPPYSWIRSHSAFGFVVW